MKESYREGVASHPGPSHARAVVRPHLKRWRGVSISWAFELRNQLVPAAKTVRAVARQHEGGR